MICSKEPGLFDPAAWSGYFFGCVLRRRDPSLTLFARDDGPDRILVFLDETMSRNYSAARKRLYKRREAPDARDVRGDDSGA
jgi:hypothetical protein